MSGMPKKAQGRQHAGFLLEMLVALRMEFTARHRSWPVLTLASRQRAVMQLWEERCQVIFADPAICRDIEQWIGSAFMHAQAGRSANAALDMKRAYLLICCVLAESKLRRP